MAGAWANDIPKSDVMLEWLAEQLGDTAAPPSQASAAVTAPTPQASTSTVAPVPQASTSASAIAAPLMEVIEGVVFVPEDADIPEPQYALWQASRTPITIDGEDLEYCCSCWRGKRLLKLYKRSGDGSSKHWRSKHMNQVFCCPYQCGKAYRHQCSLTRHVRDNHATVMSANLHLNRGHCIIE